MTTSQKTNFSNLIAVLASGIAVNAISYQFFPDYSGPVTATCLTVLCTVLIRQQGESWKDYGFVFQGKWVKLLWQVPLVFLLTVIAGAGTKKLMTLLVEVQPHVQSRFEGMEGNLPMFLLWTAIGWAVGGFMEEMIFRGFLLGQFERLLRKTKWATAMAVCAQAFLFGLVHFYNRGIAGGVTIFMVGVVMGILYLRLGRSLWPLILAHGIVDTLSFLEDYLGS